MAMASISKFLAMMASQFIKGSLCFLIENMCFITLRIRCANPAL